MKSAWELLDKPEEEKESIMARHCPSFFDLKGEYDNNDGCKSGETIVGSSSDPHPKCIECWTGKKEPELKEPFKFMQGISEKEEI